MEVTDHDLPIISIITPAFNCASYIGEAIESVLNQDYPRFEHIIMDGGSTDGTLDVVARYPHLRVISEPDQGLYDALNKGISLAQGDYLGWLNADDLYADGVFHDLGHRAHEIPAVELFTGDSNRFEDTPKGKRIVQVNKFYTDQELSEGRFSYYVALNGCFFRCDVFEHVGLFSTAYKLVSDLDFLIRLSIYGPRCASLGRVSYNYRIHKQSLTMGKKQADNTVLACKDLMSIAYQYRSQTNAPVPLRSYCGCLYRNSAATLIKHYTMKGYFIEAVRVFSTASKEDRCFMWDFPKRILTRGPIRLFRLAVDKARSIVRP